MSTPTTVSQPGEHIGDIDHLTMTSNAPVTQIIHLGFERDLDAKLDTGLWSEALDACEKSPGLRRMYWGRSHEHPEHVELHLGE